MAFVVEDGTGVDGANSLASVAESETYWNDRGRTDWYSLGTAAKQAALIEASSFVSTTVRWKGDRKDEDQPLAWPRDYRTDVPEPVRNAVIRVAYAVAIEAVDLFGTVDSSSAIQRIKAGSVEVQYADGAEDVGLSGRPSFPWLTDLLVDHIAAGAGFSKTSRKLVRS